MVLGLGRASLLPPRRMPHAAPQQRDGSLPHVSSSCALGPPPAAVPSACPPSSVGTPRGDAPALQQPAHSSDQSLSHKAHNAEPASSGLPEHPQPAQEPQPQGGQQGAEPPQQAAPLPQQPGPPGGSHAQPEAPAVLAAGHPGAAGPAASDVSTHKRQRADSQPPAPQREGSEPRQSRLAATAASSGAAGGSGRRQPSASRSAGEDMRGGGGAAPPAKRRRGAPGGKYADVLHRWVDVPGSVFSVPDESYAAQVTKAEAGRGVPAVEACFVDGDKYWFPLADVRRWMSDMVRAGSWERLNPGIPPPDFAAAAADADQAAADQAAADESEAAEALQSLSASLPGGGGRGGGTQAAVSSRQRRAGS